MDYTASDAPLKFVELFVVDPRTFDQTVSHLANILLATSLVNYTMWAGRSANLLAVGNFLDTRKT